MEHICFCLSSNVVLEVNCYFLGLLRLFFIAIAFWTFSSDYFYTFTSFLWLVLREKSDYLDLLRIKLAVDTFYILTGFFFSTGLLFPRLDLIVFSSFFIDFDGESTFIEVLRPKMPGAFPLEESFFLDTEAYYLAFFGSI